MAWVIVAASSFETSVDWFRIAISMPHLHRALPGLLASATCKGWCDIDARHHLAQGANDRLIRSAKQSRRGSSGYCRVPRRPFCPLCRCIITPFGVKQEGVRTTELAANLSLARTAASGGRQFEAMVRVAVGTPVPARWTPLHRGAGIPVATTRHRVGRIATYQEGLVPRWMPRRGVPSMEASGPPPWSRPLLLLPSSVPGWRSSVVEVEGSVAGPQVVGFPGVVPSCPVPTFASTPGVVVAVVGDMTWVPIGDPGPSRPDDLTVVVGPVRGRLSASSGGVTSVAPP